jgi:glycosyltransferase involved in cell wall biosynthesis
MECRKRKIDIMVFPGGVVPFFIRSKKVIVIHDLAYFDKCMRPYKFIDSIYMRKMLSMSASRADRIIAVSENTKKDIIKYLKAKEKKISVIYEAANEGFKMVDHREIDGVRQKYDLYKPFILYTGTLSPRKNIKNLIISFEALSGKIEHDLVLTGGYSWDDRQERKMIETSRVRGRIRVLGYVDQSDLVLLYNAAELFVYPSLYEGFGLPVLEAMQCGCPVACSNTSSLPEVGGSAAMYFDPKDVRGMTEKLGEILQDNNLRKRLSEAGIERAKNFTWEKTAEKIIKVIEGID